MAKRPLMTLICEAGEATADNFADLAWVVSETLLHGHLADNTLDLPLLKNGHRAARDLDLKPFLTKLGLSIR